MPGPYLHQLDAELTCLAPQQLQRCRCWVAVASDHERHQFWDVDGRECELESLSRLFCVDSHDMRVQANLLINIRNAVLSSINTGAFGSFLNAITNTELVNFGLHGTANGELTASRPHPFDPC